MSVLLVGDVGDPHVKVIADLLPHRGLVVVDAARLVSVLLRLDLGRTRLFDVTGAQVELSQHGRARGWLRRLAPAAWDQGVLLGSHRAAVLSSRLTLLAALLRDPAVSWVTPVDRLFAAENKLVQYRAAVDVGIRVPATIVSGDPQELADELSQPFVIKPLGPGNFEADGQQLVVFAREVMATDLAGSELLEAPFLAQETIHARRHLRVTTVQQQAWIAELDATGVPRDWREHTAAHCSFRSAATWPDVERAAVHLAAALGVGMSSQDWAVDDGGPVFLDLNPGGQWLFLPDDITKAVAQALADWLTGR
jgi:hypothetical protein